MPTTLHGLSRRHVADRHTPDRPPATSQQLLVSQIFPVSVFCQLADSYPAFNAQIG